jgi:hypothetical protein
MVHSYGSITPIRKRSFFNFHFYNMAKLLIFDKFACLSAQLFANMPGRVCVNTHIKRQGAADFHEKNKQRMQHDVQIEALNQQIYADSAFLEPLMAETNKVIVGQHVMLERL